MLKSKLMRDKYRKVGSFFASENIRNYLGLLIFAMEKWQYL